MAQPEKTVMVFGVFDLLHDGHRYFLAEARRLGTRLIAVLAEDSVVRELKGKSPRYSILQRKKNLETEKLADSIIFGDKRIDSWNVIRKNLPDIIALGYDQKELACSLGDFLVESGSQIKLKFIKPYKAGVLHSSVLRYRVGPKQT